MRRRDETPFTWSLVFKAAFIMGILFSRLGGDEDEIPFKFYALATVLISILLLQTGYAQFVYKFYFQENYAYRILVQNEDVEIAPAGVQRAQGRNNDDDNNNDNGWFDWRETFLGGRIQRAEQDQQELGVMRFLKELLYLILSFVLSILPMWHPEPMEIQVPQEEEGDVGGDDNNNEARPDPDPQDDGGPGAVQPPVDPAEPEEDEQ
jgi:hypothetical protein